VDGKLKLLLMFFEDEYAANSHEEIIKNQAEICEKKIFGSE
jgi:hypothetical protein